MKTKIMTMATLVTLLTPSTTSSGDPLAVEYLNIRFLNGNSDLTPNPDIYGDTNVARYAPKIDLTVEATGEMICASTNQTQYHLKIAIPKTKSSQIKAKVTNASSMKKYMENARINTHLIIGDLFKDNEAYGNTVDLVFRMMGQGPNNNSVHFALYPQSKRKTNKQVREELTKDKKRLQYLGRQLEDGESLQGGFFRVPIPYTKPENTKPKKRNLDSDEASKKRTKTEE